MFTRRARVASASSILALTLAVTIHFYQSEAQIIHEGQRDVCNTQLGGAAGLLCWPWGLTQFCWPTCTYVHTLKGYPWCNVYACTNDKYTQLMFKRHVQLALSLLPSKGNWPISFLRSWCHGHIWRCILTWFNTSKTPLALPSLHWLIDSSKAPSVLAHCSE